MSKWIYIIALQVLAFTASSQIPFEELSFHSSLEQNVFKSLSYQKSEVDLLALYMASDPNVTYSDVEKSKKTLDSFVTTRKLDKNPERLFYATKYRYMENFEEYPVFTSMLDDSSFNCVTGSALLAYLYSQNQADFTIHEHPHHVYLTVAKKNKRFLAESTDEYFGFRKMTSTWETVYQQDSFDTSPIFKTLSAYNGIPQTGYRVDNEITTIELAGLIYYNSAAVDVNKGDYVKAIEKLEKAFYLYPSARIMTLLKFCLITELNQSNPKDEAQLKKHFEKLQSYQPIYHWIASMD